ncbi:DNA (cytosine-5-)-methyltransferase [Collinsella sp. An2]|uniref:DNA (cytosine-5-)-methyltransferase n=1 Tax=Collinsella sp. An2 TaxID=1965585 RepID=UPI000B3A88ED|nr:DNA (cytosine-5-)-methyltransferase [Collinsella sp. An2]OUP06546.1 DNA (cytosine-5-)-methyltransferase [Collinsella sp. An2]
MSSEITVAELFAGVGGFRLGLDGYHDPEHPEFDMPAAGPFHTVWANQWEPGTDKRQFAARCYRKRFGEDSVLNEDIHTVLDRVEAGELEIPTVDMVVGGFPCQDYSVARTLSQASGIEGKKGVLWWDIYRFLRLKPKTKYCLFENVDRLLKSPASQRGRDFAIILSCLSSLGYAVEWRVINSAEYGFPQRRKRVYIYAEKTDEQWNHVERLTQGVMADAFPIEGMGECASFEIYADPADNSDSFGRGCKVSPFKTAGVMQGCLVTTADVVESYSGPRATLGDVLVSEDEVPAEYYVSSDKVADWKYLKGAKREPRKNKRTGFEYMYSEGAMAFPDSLDKPSRTILTGEGGVTPSRFKHVIETPDGRLRRLVPDELDQLQCFPRGWTNTGMTDGQRAFCMGNALVTGIPHRIGQAMARRLAC